MKKKKKRIRLRRSAKRIMTALFAISLTICIADSLRRDFFKVTNDDKIVVEGDFVSKSNPPIPTNTIVFDRNSKPTGTTVVDVKFAGFFERILTSDELSHGMLALNPVSVNEPEKMVKLSDFQNEHYTVADDNIMLHEEAAKALESLMTAYNEVTELSDFVVYGTTDTYSQYDSVCPRSFSERANGCTVDLALLGIGSYIEFDGLDTESWIVENCTKYGFIVRYPEGKSEITREEYCPWHLRYVGRVHAAVMNEKNMCLEEYIDFLKDYKVDAPYTYNLNGSAYVLYCAESEGETTSAKVPISGDYDISGDNRKTYIISYRR